MIEEDNEANPKWYQMYLDIFYPYIDAEQSAYHSDLYEGCTIQDRVHWLYQTY